MPARRAILVAYCKRMNIAPIALVDPAVLCFGFQSCCLAPLRHRRTTYPASMLRRSAAPLMARWLAHQPQLPAALGASQCSTSCSSSGRAGSNTYCSSSEEASKRHLMNKLLYRSKQRGLLELDLLVGLWAQEQVPQMSVEALEHLSVVLDQENPDLFKWLTGRLEPPEDLLHNKAYKALKQHVDEHLAQVPAAAHAPAGAEWVRGWDDTSNKGNPSPGVNQ